MTELLRQFTERAHPWEGYQCFRISDTFKLYPTFPRMGQAIQPPSTRLVHSCPRPSNFATGTSTNQNSGVMVSSWSSYPVLKSSINSDRYAEDSSHIFTPFMGVRKALSVRILNFFADGQETAYTIWVYDVEIGHGWYAPVRYLRDFADLRIATVTLRPEISSIPFPSHGWFCFERITSSEPVRRNAGSLNISCDHFARQSIHLDCTLLLRRLPFMSSRFLGATATIGAIVLLVLVMPPAYMFTPARDILKTNCVPGAC